MRPARRSIWIIVAALLSTAPLPIFTAPPTPLERLRLQIARAIPAAQGEIGVGVKHLESGVELFVSPDEPFPMASTFKLPILVELHALAKSGALKWDELVEIGPRDQHLGSGELSVLYDLPGLHISMRNLANLMMMISDNSAADICLARAGVKNVNARLNALGVSGIRVDRSCQELILDYGGHDTERLKGLALKELRAALPGSSRDEPSRWAADDRFAKDPRDTATPRGFVTLLEKIWRGEVIDKGASQDILNLMKRCQTGVNRIRGLLPADTEVAHKTGTVGGVVNDVGIVYLPDGAGHVAVALLSKRTRVNSEQVEKTLAQIARYVYDYFYFAPGSSERPSAGNPAR
jgi:beta-lactamase class A